LGFAMGGAHALLGAIQLASCMDQNSDTLSHRLTNVGAEALTAAGHFVAASGAGAWSIPLVAAGILVNTVEDYRWNK